MVWPFAAWRSEARPSSSMRTVRNTKVGQIGNELRLLLCCLRLNEEPITRTAFLRHLFRRRSQFVLVP
jgi:hypothetical protein